MVLNWTNFCLANLVRVILSNFDEAIFKQFAQLRTGFTWRDSSRVWPVCVAVACGLCVWLWRVAYVCGCGMWSVAVACGLCLRLWRVVCVCGCGVWPVCVACGLYLRLWHVAYVCGCGVWPMSVACGLCLWLWRVAYVCSVWPMSVACGLCLRLWRVAYVCGVWPMSVAVACGLCLRLWREPTYTTRSDATRLSSQSCTPLPQTAATSTFIVWFECLFLEWIKNTSNTNSLY